MFTQPCLIRKNTKELRSSLKELGYRVYDSSDAWFILTGFGYYDLLEDDCAASGNRIEAIDEIKKMNLDKSIIDCGTNEEMFLALAALRDNSDYDQWFVCNEDSTFWTLCVHDEFHFIQINPDDIMQYLDWKDDFHKATPQEIIKHFKK